MMMSLFSMFDPMANFNMMLNWSMLILTALFLPMKMWTVNSRLLTIFHSLIFNLHKEFFSLFSKNILSKGSTLITSTLFLIILTTNLTSNFPYTFCSSAHLTFSLSTSIPIWLSILIYQWMTLTKTMLSHLVPSGTPSLLMPLMVLIEITSNIIRPIALAVRLSANLIAGHLLMTLLGNMMDVKQPIFIIISIVQVLFLTFELMVALIQSYVFSVLLTLYSSEIS